jgi:hypothetical protein
MHPLARAALGVTAAGVVGVGYASLVERNLFVLRRHTVPVLAPGSRSLRVLHLTDLHLMPTQERKIAWIQALAEVEPDLVVNTGDNIAHPESIGPLLRAFEPLLGVPGVFVLGSNDYFAPRLKNPALYLTREHRRGSGRSRRLPTDRLVAGVRVRRVDGADQPADAADRGRRRSRARRGRRSAPGLRPVCRGGRSCGAGCRADDGRDPRPLSAGARRDDGRRGRVGHRRPHARRPAVPARLGRPGDQLRPGHPPRQGRLPVVARRGGRPPRRRREGAAYLEVSAGLGTSPMAPVRFACRPEASLLTLVPPRRLRRPPRSRVSGGPRGWGRGWPFPYAARPPSATH